jgi:hypothetical protein
VLSKIKMVAAAALVLGVSSAAQAGGSPVGPLGQVFGSGVNPALHPAIFDRPDKIYDYSAWPRQRARSDEKANSR